MRDYLVPLILFVSMALALGKKENAYDHMLSGAAEGLRLIVSILPALILLLCAVHMLQASGAAEIISAYLSPIFVFFGIPPETALLVLVRPLSGSAALAMVIGLLPLMFASGVGKNGNQTLGAAAVGGMLIGTICQ